MKSILRKSVLSLSALFLLLTLSSFTSSNTSTEAFRRWHIIGTKNVDYKLDKDAFYFKPNGKKYSKFQFVVKNGRLNMHKCVVHFRNGQRQVVNLKGNFNPGDKSRIIDLAGDKRNVEKIVFVYDTKTRSRRKAQVVLMGLRH